MTNLMIKRLSLSLFLSGSCLFGSAFASDDDVDDIPLVPVAGLPVAGDTAQVELSPKYPSKPLTYYHDLLCEREKDEKKLQVIIEEALSTTHDLIHDLQKTVQEKKNRLDLPEGFIEEFHTFIKLQEPCDLFNEEDRLNLSLRRVTLPTLDVWKETLGNLAAFFQKWSNISGHLHSVTLALDQSLQYQNSWDSLFARRNRNVLNGCDLYYWFGAFQKTLVALNYAALDFSRVWQTPPHPLFGPQNQLVDFYTRKNAGIWELIKTFIHSLPDYDDLSLTPTRQQVERYWLLKEIGKQTEEEIGIFPSELVQKCFLLQYEIPFLLGSNAREWLRYFSRLEDSWPFDLMEMPEITSVQSLFSAISKPGDLNESEKANLANFWNTEGKGLWNSWKTSLQTLSTLNHDQVLGTLYPNEWQSDSYSKLLKLFDFIGLWNHPIEISNDFRAELREIFSSSPEWQETATGFKASLKPFTNTGLITSLLPELQAYYTNFNKKYTEDFHRTLDFLTSPAICTFSNGKRLTVPQSSVYKAFPDLHKKHTIWPNGQKPEFIPSSVSGLHILPSPKDIGGRYALSVLAKLFDLPTHPFTVSFFSDILVHKLSRENTLLIGGGRDVQLTHRLPCQAHEIIDIQREARVQEYFKDPEKWPVSLEKSFALIQEKFTGGFLQDFLTNMSQGKPVFFEQLDADSVFRHALFCLVTGVSIPLENWGLIPQENGKFGLIMLGDNLGENFLLSSPNASCSNILYLLPFATQNISEAVKQDFLSHEDFSLLTHWLMALTKIQEDFENTFDDQTRLFSKPGNRLATWVANLRHIQKLLTQKNITYGHILKNLNHEARSQYSSFWETGKKDHEKNKTTLFFKNILPPTIQALNNTLFSQEELGKDASACLENFKTDSTLSIEKLLEKVESQSSRLLFQSIYQTTRDVPFFEAQQILNQYKYPSETTTKQATESESTLASLSSLLVEVLCLVDANQPHDQLIETLLRLFQMYDGIGITSEGEKCWTALGKKIVRSQNLTLIQRFCSIHPKMVTYAYPDNPLQSLSVFKRVEFNLPQSPRPKKNDKETLAAHSFYALWDNGNNDPVLRGLLDLLLLPRYAAEREIPELEEMGGYLSSTGFASHPLSSQHVGRSKSSRTGPVALVVEDGQHYVLAWSERWVNAFHSSDPVPAKTREAILNQSIPLLGLVWLSYLQDQKLPITFYPWFIKTFVEKGTEMQELLKDNPLSTFPEILEQVWPQIFAAFDYHLKIPKTSGTIINKILTRENYISLNEKEINWDWIPQGKKQNLESILEDWVNEYGPGCARANLSLTDAATDILNYFMATYTPSCDPEITEQVLAHVTKLGVNSRNVSCNQTVVERILDTLTKRKEQTRFGCDAQRLAISLYAQCPLQGIDVGKDYLKISGTHSMPENLAKVISFYPDIKNLDISNNNLKNLSFCKSFLVHRNSLLNNRSPRLVNLETLNISDNPLWDPSPLSCVKPISNLIFSHTYIPDGPCFFYLTSWPAKDVSTANEPTPPQQGRVFGMANQEEVQAVIQFYKNTLNALKRTSEAQQKNHDACVVGVVYQMAQNFWLQTLADEQLAPDDLEKSGLFDYIEAALSNKTLTIPEISRKWFFALKNGLPRGVTSQDLGWDETQRVYSLSRLKILNGTDQDYLMCLKQSQEHLSKDSNNTWHKTVVTLAVNNLAQNFWEKASGLKSKDKPQKILDIVADHNAATPEAKKLAFAWQYKLPKGTDRDSLCFSPLCATHLTTLVISGLDPKHHTLDFLKPLTHLTKLVLNHCGLGTARNLPVLRNLRELDLSKNSLKSLLGLYTEENPSFKFQALENLDLSHNQICFTAEEWGKPATRLFSFYKAGFRDSFCHLKQLNLSHNAITIAPVMLQPNKAPRGNAKTTTEKPIFFNITHNLIPFSELWKLYEFTFFWNRSEEATETIIPQKNHQHPIHIFYEDNQLFCQIYKNNHDLSKKRWNISNYTDCRLVKRLKNTPKNSRLTLGEKDKQSLIDLIINKRANYLNTEHLQVIPQNEQ